VVGEAAYCEWVGEEMTVVQPILLPWWLYIAGCSCAAVGVGIRVGHDLGWVEGIIDALFIVAGAFVVSAVVVAISRSQEFRER
jgi:hypothetical protein